MNDVEATFRDAVAALNAGKFSDAERLFRTVLKRQPAHAGALNLLTIALMQMQRFAEAEGTAKAASRASANSDVTFYNYGIILKRLGKPDEALKQFDRALRLNPNVAQTWNNRGTVFNDLKRFENAIADFDRAISLDPQYADAHCNKGKSLLALNRLDEASAAYENALMLRPNMAEAWLGQGNACLVGQRNKQALQHYERALSLNQNLVEAWLGHSNALARFNRHEEALRSNDKALAVAPNLADVWTGRGDALFGLNRHNEALAAYDQALALVPDLTAARLGRGNAHFELNCFDAALADYDAAVQSQPDLAEAWLGRGNVFCRQRQYNEAIAAYDRAIALNSNLAEVWLGRGNVYADLNRHSEALDAYAKALELKAVPGAWLGRGNVFYHLKRFDDAMAAYDRAVSLRPDFPEAWLGRGQIFADLKRHDQAFAAFDKAFQIDPAMEVVEGVRLHAKMQNCDWNNFDAEASHLISSVMNGIPTPPFAFLPIASTPEQQLQCAKLHATMRFPPGATPAWTGEIYRHDRIRVAYLSADFRVHPVSYLMAGVFERHDRGRFETIAISLGEDEQSAMRSRLKIAFDRFVDADGQSDTEIAGLVRSLEADIVVDLMGYTSTSRTGILARRAAPIQVNYLGYAGTMGASYIDYILADPTVILPKHREHFTEQVAYLPNTFMPSDLDRPISDRPFTRAEFGLPQTGFVFCCFNNSYKLNPKTFDRWMRILKKVEGSVLWLSENSPLVVENLKREAASRGVTAERLVFAGRMPLLSEHLARHRLADLFLDTLPFNAHTTANDALWAGLPVLTLLGDAFPGRVAASLLNAIELPELITHTEAEYEALAVDLASDPGRLRLIRKKLDGNRLTKPLFDTTLITRHLEDAFSAMIARYHAGLPPGPIAPGSAA
jgi:protein O-GlcNAc transferase